jgi:hypothetical protein
MGDFNKILKLATVYSLYTFADLRENMALRIFHALIPTLVKDIHNAQEIKNIQEFMAFDLIPGAKEIFVLGAKAVAYEFDCSSNEDLKKEIQQAISNGHYTKGLELATTGFLSGFKETTGNKVWSNIAKHLLNLEKMIKNVEDSGSQADAIKLSYYLDTIDQLVHNTGSLMEKLIQQEMGSIHPDAQSRYQELLRLRDISKMEGSHPPTILMQQHIKSMPKEYRDWYKQYLATNPENEKDYNSALELLSKTKQQRELEQYLTIPETSYNIIPVAKKPPAPPRKPAPS